MGISKRGNLLKWGISKRGNLLKRGISKRGNLLKWGISKKGNLLKRGISKLGCSGNAASMMKCEVCTKKLFLTTTVSAGLSCLSVELQEAIEPIYFFSVFL